MPQSWPVSFATSRRRTPRFFIASTVKTARERFDDRVAIGHDA
jgi:hypothetical protein